MKYLLILPLLIMSSLKSSYTMFTPKNIKPLGMIARQTSSQSLNTPVIQKSSKFFRGVFVGAATMFGTTLYWEKIGEKKLQNIVKKIDEVFESFYPGL